MQLNLEQAALALASGAVVAVPTQTFYGLAADAPRDNLFIMRVTTPRFVSTGYKDVEVGVRGPGQINQIASQAGALYVAPSDCTAGTLCWPR